MSVPCACKIPDPVVVNGKCLVCYGDRESKPLFKCGGLAEFVGYLKPENCSVCLDGRGCPLHDEDFGEAESREGLYTAREILG